MFIEGNPYPLEFCLREAGPPNIDDENTRMSIHAVRCLCDGIVLCDRIDKADAESGYIRMYSCDNKSRL